jgi:large subunit ribosomal protein L30
VTGSPAESGVAYLRVRQVRSSIGTKPSHRGTLRALGLKRIGDERVLPDVPSVRGMLRKVPHLVVFEAAEGPGSDGGVRRVRRQRERVGEEGPRQGGNG